MSFLAPLLYVLAVCGHLAIWTALFNQVHATSWPRWVRKVLEKTVYVCVLALALLLILAESFGLNSTMTKVIHVYRILCYVAFGLIVVKWVYQKANSRRPEEVVSIRRQLIDLKPRLGSSGYRGWEANLLGMIPGNQSLKLSIEHRIVNLATWPQELDGLVIAHLSDLHFTGKVPCEYFEQVFKECHECNPDIICLTGDVVDEPDCLKWLGKVLPQAKGHFGNFYILGNHDRRVKDENLLRGAIEDGGYSRVSPGWLQVEVRGTQLWLAGNELPWYGGAEKLTPASDSPSIALSHSPDQVFWAEKLGVDLVLAGHCHGGQIRVPWIGPLVSPSKYGIRFAAGEGTFKVGKTLMHVSRGISGADPIRLFCPPELSILKINCGSKKS